MAGTVSYLTKNIAVIVQYNEHGAKMYQLHGPLFFASVAQFKELFDAKSDPEVVVIDFYYARVYDHSGMEAIHTVAEKYRQSNKVLHLTHLSDECRRMLKKAGDLVDVSLSNEPQFHIKTDRLKRKAPESSPHGV